MQFLKVTGQNMCFDGRQFETTEVTLLNELCGNTFTNINVQHLNEKQCSLNISSVLV